MKLVSFYDGLGRTTESRNYEANGNYRAVQTQYDSFSRPYRRSNPFRPNEIDGSHPILWTVSRFDALGRAKEIETPDGAKVITAYHGNRALVTDQAGKQRIAKTNSLGELTDVWEITAPDSATTAVTFPNHSEVAYGYQTGYVYDALGNLTAVNQGAQTRSFAYNSLSRLTSVTNPESGTISYGHDANGNLTSKSQVRSGSANVVTAYTYDALNRPLQRSYSTPNGTPSNYQTTPTVSYTYDDPNIALSKGNLTKVSSSVSTTDYLSFDQFGRVTRSKQTTDGVVYGNDTNPMTYTYNLSGALVEQKYPSGRVVRNSLDNAGDLSQVESKKDSTAGYWTYAGNFTYNAAGAATSIRLGNGHWESTQFNARLQPTQIALGLTAGATNLLKLDYSYGTTQNNGNVQSQTITVPGLSDPFVQAYTYDSLNRLLSASETNNTSPVWKQTFTYDRYGNRNIDEANTTTLTKACGTSPNFTVCTADRKKENPAVNASDNRFTSGQDYTYDLTGSITADADSQSYIYDGENKMVQASNGGGPLGTYYYDGDGERVKKVVPNGETTVFVYDASGKMVAEYSTELNSTPQTSYLTSDSLGSPRINTNTDGAVISRHDYRPFGE